MSSAQPVAATGEPSAIYYQDSPQFEGERNVVIPQTRSLDGVTFFSPDDEVPKRVIADFRKPHIQNVGRLHGEYACLNTVETAGTYLFERNGNCVKINYAKEEEWAGRRDAYCETDTFRRLRDELLASWDSLPRMPSMPLLAVQNHHNYYHFTFDFLAKLSLFSDQDNAKFAVPLGMIQLPYQKNMLIRCMGQRDLYPMASSVRMVDPLIASTAFTDVGFEWLRKQARFPTVLSNRRVYVRRTTSTWGRTGAIVEDDNFLRFLRDFGFDVIDFRLGDLTFEQQVGLISGARVVLMSHSSALTNLLYLNKPVSVVEVLGARWAWKPLMELSTAMGFNYYGVVERRYDPKGDIHVDVDRLREIMRLIEQE